MQSRPKKKIVLVSGSNERPLPVGFWPEVSSAMSWILLSWKDPSEEDPSVAIGACGDGPTRDTVRLWNPAVNCVCDQVYEQLVSSDAENPSIFVCTPSKTTTKTPASEFRVEPRYTAPPSKDLKV